MRVIAGALKNLIFSDNHSRATHPMSEKVRGAIFNTLGDVEGLTMLDACAGTGLVGFEALSRGAKCVVAVERDPKAYSELRHRLQVLPKEYLKRYLAVHAGIRQFLLDYPEKKFDVIICDPPYDDLQATHFAEIYQALKQNGILVFSQPNTGEALALPGLQAVKESVHGDAKVVYYRHE